MTGLADNTIARDVHAPAESARGAEDAYRRGLELDTAGRSRRAAHAWRRAARQGHAEAAALLAARAAARGRGRAAEHWWRRAARADHSGSMHRLGMRLVERGSVQEGEAFLNAAVQA